MLKSYDCWKVNYSTLRGQLKDQSQQILSMFICSWSVKLCNFSFVYMYNYDALVSVQVFHKIITSGLPRLQPLYDCLLTVMVNGETVDVT